MRVALRSMNAIGAGTPIASRSAATTDERAPRGPRELERRILRSVIVAGRGRSGARARWPPPCPIEDYALVGDCETAALVGRDGSIDWLCWPRFDSAACFAALVGSRDNGRWLMSAADPKARIRRRYRDSTLILETAIETADGAATVVDFMPPRDQASAVVRLVFGRRGRIAMRTELIIRFDYGSLTPWVTRLHDGSLHAVAGPDMVVLRTAVAAARR